MKNTIINPSKPVVFLDIDGVLNSAAYFKRRYAKEKPETVESILKRERPLNERMRDHCLRDLDEEAISYLNEIADYNFILSSAWRKSYSLEFMNSILEEKGFNGKIISYTPILNTPFTFRGNEIYAWISENIRQGSSFKNYVIFDDDSDILYWQKDNFFHVDGYFGLGPNHVYRAKLFLENKNNLLH